ncbi:hypothetical protein BABINDRAFT_69346 [Babjeviella inositovora NRRL Y-12698]|uniref:Uncharacterized protein n=1 Tax=Babjeviella inositovora NRRL Y-12698 TaxID=984486 RepID=A0A1E3QXA8_9ASCO|nr:uncharacterized protein BABINDRAFT_69346 [Babjeviella inositovora NRRL Y-12698]ODQ82231.1 hypothetical protein BABINDRAFT_69346 [Babjeviella inositovora NRRL Y-12698]
MSEINPKLQNESEASTYVASLGDRPALFALTGLLASFPVVKIFASNSIPLMMSRNRSQNKGRGTV